jgi:hypothetical protein
MQHASVPFGQLTGTACHLFLWRRNVSLGRAAAQLKYPAAKNLKVFPVNGGECKAHAHAHYGVTDLSLSFKGVVLAADAYFYNRARRERAERIHIAASLPEVGSAPIDVRVGPGLYDVCGGVKGKALMAAAFVATATGATSPGSRAGQLFVHVAAPPKR